MKNKTFGQKVIEFYRDITPPSLNTKEAKIINPHTDGTARECIEQFYEYFYSDTKNRTYVFGINPGRFGSGVTGIPFTDPVALESSCGIFNSLEKRTELSSDFVYRFIASWGGARKFYDDFFLTAVSPLGFIKNGKNYNYYDDRSFFQFIRPFIIDSIKMQLDFGANRNSVIVFGTGKNKQIFNEINSEYGFFKNIYVLEHPRYIMQYKRKFLSEYLENYQKFFLMTQPKGG